jgi:hypothetical protein
MKSKSIALVSGGWGQNVGNAFFNIGGLHVLRRLFPDHNVQFIQDQPGYWTFNRSRINPRNYWGLLKYLNIDYIVLQGPVFSLALPKLWDDTLCELYKRGGKVIYLSSSLFRYTDDEVLVAKKFLRKFPPAFMSTRDAVSYDKLKGYCDKSYNGICSAWFVPDVYTPPSLDCDPYIAVNFDRRPEPKIVVSSGAGRHDYVVNHESLSLDICFPKVIDAFSKNGKASAYIGAFLDRRKLPGSVGGYVLVRPEHRTNPYFNWKIYGRPNGIASDEPYTYFTTYANAELTLTDRVHACLITLAYGKPAMLFTSSPRSHLFARMGLMGRDGIKKVPVLLDKKILENEKSEEIKSLSHIVQSL